MHPAVSINLICLSVLFFVYSNAQSLNPQNSIKQGGLTGRYMRTRNGRQISAYLGIPYAKPPIGNLRFRPPIPAEPWSGNLNATEPGSSCAQGAIIYDTPFQGNENCLFLNLYTPQLHKTERRSYAVMVYIHGGGFALDTGNGYGPDYLLDYDVILVTFNYRLSALGFMTTGDENLPANNGLKDQSLAIKWVHENVDAFGGDPKRITLFGESSGGVSVHYHMFSPLTKGLFHAAISQSGTLFSITSIVDPKALISNSKRLSQYVGCPTGNNAKMVECLRSVDARNISEAVSIFAEWDTDPVMIFMPTIETNHRGAFLTDDPVSILKSGKYANVPWISGMNSEEGLYRAAYLYTKEDLLRDLNQDFSRIMAITLNDKDPEFDRFGKQIRNFYFGNKTIDNSTVVNLALLYSDIHFVSAIHLAVQLHLKYSNQPVYHYVFSHQGRNSFSELFGTPPFIYGTSHLDDLMYLFPFESSFGNTTLSQGDRHYSNLLCTMWTNFAKRCDPTPDTDVIISSRWEPVKTRNLEYFNIGGGVHTSSNAYPKRIQFWERLNKIRNLNIREESML